MSNTHSSASGSSNINLSARLTPAGAAVPLQAISNRERGGPLAIPASFPKVPRWQPWVRRRSPIRSKP